MVHVYGKSVNLRSLKDVTV